MNSVQLIGRLTRDPNPDLTTNGEPVTTFRLAVDRPGDGADFVTIKTWGRLATAVAEHLGTGRRVAVRGRLAHSEWTDAQGQRTERLFVIAGHVEFLDPPTGQPRREPSAVQPSGPSR